MFNIVVQMSPLKSFILVFFLGYNVSVPNRVYLINFEVTYRP